MAQPAPKVTHFVPKDQRSHNDLKPAPKPKKKPTGLKPGGPIGRNSTLGVGKKTLQHKKPSLSRYRKRQAQKFWVSAGKRRIEKGKRKALALRSMTPAAIERRRLDRIWVEKVWSIWGACIITGATKDHAVVDAHHCWDKSIRPQWRHEPWNGLLLRRDVHGKADEWPDFHEACQMVADECRAAAEGRRPMPTRTEAREILFTHCPKIRQYARAEGE